MRRRDGQLQVGREREGSLLRNRETVPERRSFGFDPLVDLTPEVRALQRVTIEDHRNIGVLREAFMLSCYAELVGTSVGEVPQSSDEDIKDALQARVRDANRFENNTTGHSAEEMSALYELSKTFEWLAAITIQEPERRPELQRMAEEFNLPSVLERVMRAMSDEWRVIFSVARLDPAHLKYITPEMNEMRWNAQWFNFREGDWGSGDEVSDRLLAMAGIRLLVDDAKLRPLSQEDWVKIFSDGPAEVRLADPRRALAEYILGAESAQFTPDGDLQIIYPPSPVVAVEALPPRQQV